MHWEAHFNLILFINTVSWLKEIKNTGLCGTCDHFYDLDCEKTIIDMFVYVCCL